MTNDQVLDILSESTGAERGGLLADAPFADMRIDSLDFMLFIDDMEDVIGKKIPDGAAGDFKTPADVTAWCNA